MNNEYANIQNNHQLNDNNICIQVISAGYDAGNYAKISINNIPIIMQPNLNQHYRGLHVIVINPENARIASLNVFDTYSSSNEF